MPHGPVNYRRRFWWLFLGTMALSYLIIAVRFARGSPDAALIMGVAAVVGAITFPAGIVIPLLSFLPFGSGQKDFVTLLALICSIVGYAVYYLLSRRMTGPGAVRIFAVATALLIFNLVGCQSDAMLGAVSTIFRM